MGADEVIDYRTQDFTHLREIDLVLDTIGGDTLKKSWAILSDGGRIVTLVSLGSHRATGSLARLCVLRVLRRGFQKQLYVFVRENFRLLRIRFSLDEARAAMEKQATGM